MPNLFDKVKLPYGHDSRIKYSVEDKQLVKDLHLSGVSQRAISRETGISRRMISFILFPERLELSRQQFKERRKDGRYYDKERNRLAVAKLRSKKIELVKQGVMNVTRAK